MDLAINRNNSKPGDLEKPGQVNKELPYYKAKVHSHY